MIAIRSSIACVSSKSHTRVRQFGPWRSDPRTTFSVKRLGRRDFGFARQVARGRGAFTDLVGAIDSQRGAIGPGQRAIRRELEDRTGEHVVLREAERKGRRAGVRDLLNVLI